MPQAFFDKDLAETMSYWATTLAILFALIGGAYALWKYRADRKHHIGDQARNAYGAFMKLALEHPEFFPGCWTSIHSDPVQRNKFEWYIAHFLWSSEDILTHDPKDRGGYVAGIRDTILEHSDYFSSDAFAEKEASGYCSSLQRLIADSVRKAEVSDETNGRAAPTAGTGAKPSGSDTADAPQHE